LIFPGLWPGAAANKRPAGSGGGANFCGGGTRAIFRGPAWGPGFFLFSPRGGRPARGGDDGKGSGIPKPCSRGDHRAKVFCRGMPAAIFFFTDFLAPKASGGGRARTNGTGEEEKSDLKKKKTRLDIHWAKNSGAKKQLRKKKKKKKTGPGFPQDQGETLVALRGGGTIPQKPPGTMKKGRFPRTTQPTNGGGKVF